MKIGDIVKVKNNKEFKGFFEGKSFIVDELYDNLDFVFIKEIKENDPGFNYMVKKEYVIQ